MQATAAALNYPAKKSLYVNKEYFSPLYSHKGSFYGGKSYQNLSGVIGIFKISPDRLR